MSHNIGGLQFLLGALELAIVGHDIAAKRIQHVTKHLRSGVWFAVVSISNGKGVQPYCGHVVQFIVRTCCISMSCNKYANTTSQNLFPVSYWPCSVLKAVCFQRLESLVCNRGIKRFKYFGKVKQRKEVKRKAYIKLKLAFRRTWLFPDACSSWMCLPFT